LCARSWLTERNGTEAHPILCRSPSIGLAGPRVPAHSLAGCAGHRRSSAHLGLKLSSAARGGWECGQLGSRPQVRADSITSSAPSAASARMDMGGSKPSFARRGTSALIAQTILTILTQTPPWRSTADCDLLDRACQQLCRRLRNAGAACGEFRRDSAKNPNSVRFSCAEAHVLHFEDLPSRQDTTMPRQ
jgi:hypothetical protein